MWKKPRLIALKITVSTPRIAEKKERACDASGYAKCQNEVFVSVLVLVRVIFVFERPVYFEHPHYVTYMLAKGDDEGLKEVLGMPFKLTDLTLNEMHEFVLESQSVDIHESVRSYT